MRPPDDALAVSLIFTKATDQAIILQEAPSHVCSTSILRNSLAHDKRFEQVSMSEAAPGDIIIESGWQKAAGGHAGIVVDHGRIVSNSSQGVRNDCSLLEFQRHHLETAVYRYVGFRNYYRSKPLANVGFNPDEPRIPAGQPGGGQWTTGMAPSTVALSGKHNRIISVAPVTKDDEPDQSHDNSGGNPGVLIYTNNKDTYNRYITTQSKYGQLASAKVIYVGSPDSPNDAFLAAGNSVNVSPQSNNVTYGNRVTINPGESWYYCSPQDANSKAEERAFIAISSLTPSMVGFSPTAGASRDLLDAVIAEANRAVLPVDAEIRSGGDIETQGKLWEDYVADRMPSGSRLPPTFKTAPSCVAGRIPGAKFNDFRTLRDFLGDNDITLLCDSSLLDYHDVVARFVIVREGQAAVRLPRRSAARPGNHRAERPSGRIMVPWDQSR